MQAIGQIAEGTAYLQQGKYNQAVAERNALNTERDASAEEMQLREQVRRTIGAQVAAQAASGFETGTGSALDALQESQVNGMVDAMTLRGRAGSQAAAIRQGGTLARMQSRSAATAKFFGAAESLARSATSYAGGAG